MQPFTDDDTEIRVLLIEDHEKVRAAVRAILESADGIQVVGEAAEGQEAVTLAAEQHPDVAVLGGDAAVSLVLGKLPDTRVLLMTSFDDVEYARGFVDQGAAGCVLKDD